MNDLIETIFILFFLSCNLFLFSRQYLCGDHLTEYLIAARISDKDMKFINENYPVFEAKFPDLEFIDFIGFIIDRGVEALKEKRTMNT
jgi:hypothetical protein